MRSYVQIGVMLLLYSRVKKKKNKRKAEKKKRISR